MSATTRAPQVPWLRTQVGVALATAALLVLAGTTRARGQEPSTVAYVGCSITRDTIAGYHALGGTRFWETADFGGALHTWASERNTTDTWDRFDALLAAHPETGEVWWQLCRSDDEEDQRDEELYESARAILTQLRARVGQIPVHVSPQPGYVAGHLCKGTGADGPARMLVLAARLVDEGLVLRGPDFPALGPEDLRDECHADEAGQRLLGSVLRSWFDGEVDSAAPTAGPDPPSPAPTAQPSAPSASGASADDDGTAWAAAGVASVAALVAVGSAFVAVRGARGTGAGP